MRRTDREVTDFNEMVDIMKRCDVCRIAMFDEEYPYILPLNFGMRVDGESIMLYFHGALKGKKYELFEANNKAAFEMDCSHRLVTEPETGNCTMTYESVIGKGVISYVKDEDKVEALNLLMSHYHVDKEFEYNKAVVPKTKVFQLQVTSMTAKKLMK